ncbi:hypothetical protein [Tateyamaria sp. Alg231-49]|uniref:hypothetical protein n=1 Tax=Tateyamaria sp. Alg231-49 TaxID=1922219 RepID=UPI000D55A42F|nr:hypothetical protein [Tateyamaria sp. Alg231-49]
MTDLTYEDFLNLSEMVTQHNHAHRFGDETYATRRLIEIDAITDGYQCPIARQAERILSTEIRGVQVVIAGHRVAVSAPHRGMIATFEVATTGHDQVRSILLALAFGRHDGTGLTGYERSRLMRRVSAVL